MDEVRRALVFDAEQELVKLKARKKLVARAGLELPPLLSGIRVTATSKRRLIRRASGVEQQRAGAAAAVVGEEFRGPEYRTYKVLSVFWSLVGGLPALPLLRRGGAQRGGRGGHRGRPFGICARARLRLRRRFGVGEEQPGGQRLRCVRP